eukprot:NODE_3261_length_1012_cov_293.224299_g2999_i0.p1 GENE.NODE_3261_length_1012_cov_293.224299_g2999_i0~~NODE_3261_length_1012_cov_293.224299_g2999_i0.p1  ORF type:complete len:315 (-),score=86.48 NODE_3261_length_1012_cov_293.224299_g2999_i0:66-947(-)
MKINVASPSCGTLKQYEVIDEKKLHLLYEKRIAQEFDGEIIGEQFKGYVLRITGGQDKQGFPMKQGVLTNSRVRLLLNRGDVGYQRWRGRKGERRRKTVRGCIVAHDIAVLHTIILEEGEEKIEGLTDHTVPRRLGPKRANNIRKLFNLTNEDDVRKYVIRRTLPANEERKKKERTKAPKIQRLITPTSLERRKKKRFMLQTRREKSFSERAAYQHLLDRRKSMSAMKKKNRAARKMLGERLKELTQIAARKQKAELQRKKQAAAAKAKEELAKKSAKKAAPAKPATKKSAKK